MKVEVTRSDARDEIVDAHLLEELGEERGPVGLDVDVGGLHQSRDLVGLLDNGNESETLTLKLEP